MSLRRAIGVDAGGTKLLVGVVDERLDVSHREQMLWPGGGLDPVMDAIAGAVERARHEAPDVVAVGFGIPALVDRETGAARSSVHLPLDEVPFRSLMARRLGLPVVVDNDATAALVAEARHGAARGARHAALLTIGTGIGGGLLVDGRIYRGANGFGGELGHIVVDLDGAPCFDDCPGRGCLEAVASGSALARMGRAAAGRLPGSALGRALEEQGEITGITVTEAALAGDAVALEVVGHAARRLGAGLVGIVNALNPEVIVVGGGVMALGELMLGPARDVVAERALRPSREAVRIAEAEFGEDAGMLGAALLAMEEGQ
jgi:glucokinase